MTISRRGYEVSVYFSGPLDRLARPDRPARIATLGAIFDGPRRKSRRDSLFSYRAATPFALLFRGLVSGRGERTRLVLPRGTKRDLIEIDAIEFPTRR